MSQGRFGHLGEFANKVNDCQTPSAWNWLVRGDESVQKLIRFSMLAQCSEIILQIYSLSRGQRPSFQLIVHFWVMGKYSQISENIKPININYWHLHKKTANKDYCLYLIHVYYHIDR